MKQTYFGFQHGHAVKLTSRRFPQREFASAAYKSDGKEEKNDDDDDDADVQAAVKEIKKSVKEYKEEVIAKAFAEVEKLKAEGKTISDDLKTQLEALKVTVLDVEGKVINMDAKKERTTKIVTKQQFEIGISNTMITELEKHKDELMELSKQTSKEALKGRFSLEEKVNVVTSGSLSGVAYNTILDWRPGMEPVGQIHVRDLVRTIQSEFDTVHYPRANTPIGLGSAGQQVNETDTKAQVDRGYTMIDLTLKANAAYIIVSRPSLRNIPFLGTWLPVSMLEQLQDYEDASFSQTIVGAATGSTTGLVTPPTGLNADNLIKMVKNLYKAKYKATAIAVDPDVWAALLTYKASTSGEYTIPIGTVNISPTGVVFLLGIPVYPVNWLTGGRAIVADWTKIAIVESEGLTWRMSENVASQFITNEVTFLIERVEGVAIFRPDAIVTYVLATS